jgi:hypothetical protein
MPVYNMRHLPYRMFDQYRSERIPTAMPTLDLIGDGLRAKFTPQVGPWGEKKERKKGKETEEKHCRSVSCGGESTVSNS